MIGHVLKHEGELLCIIIEVRINGQKRAKKLYIKKMISDKGLISYGEFKRLVGDRKE